MKRSNEWAGLLKDGGIHIPILAVAVTLVLGFSCVTGSQAADEAKLTTWMMQDDLTLLSPRDWQVFQRQTRLSGQMMISGRVSQPCDRVEFRLTGKPLSGTLPREWRRLPLNEQTRAFNAWIPAPAGGWYQFELRALKNDKVIATRILEHVGVGEVFIGAGQSNSTNNGEFRTTVTSGMVSATDGVTWQLANDPQPGPHDLSVPHGAGAEGGSFWPAFGDAMYAKYHVPIGVAVTGHGGTSVAQWQPGGELFNWTMGRVNQLGKGGFRALLWHQGETDVLAKNMNYFEDLKNIIRASNYQAGWQFPWFVARATYLDPPRPNDAMIRADQKRIWDEGVALEGPDTDTLIGDNRDFEGKGTHFSPKGLKAHGQMWAEKVSVYLDPILAASDLGADKF